MNWNSKKYALEPLLSESQIDQRNNELALQIDRDYANRSLVVMIVANGALFFAVDLIRLIHVPVVFDIIAVSSYAGTTSTSRPAWRSTIKVEITDKDVLIVDDILDTGHTLKTITDQVKRLRPKTVKSCVILEKIKASGTPFQVDYAGFQIDDRFVVGYGLDYNESFRTLPYVAALTIVDES